MIQFFRDRKNKVVVCTTQIIKGTEIHIFDKKLDGQFSINGQEINKGDTLFFENTTQSETAEWLLQCGFIRDDN